MKGSVFALALALLMPPSDDERAACKPDALEFCLGNALIMNIPGVVHCLAAHQQKISQPCRDVLKRRGIIKGEQQ
jgi:hypothetical protein